MSVKCWVHIFSGSFGSSVDVRTRNNLFWLIIELLYFVDQRTWNNCYACNSRVILFAEISSQFCTTISLINH